MIDETQAYGNCPAGRGMVLLYSQKGPLHHGRMFGLKDIIEIELCVFQYSLVLVLLRVKKCIYKKYNNVPSWLSP